MLCWTHYYITTVSVYWTIVKIAFLPEINIHANNWEYSNIYWSKLPTQHGFWRTSFCFLYLSKYFSLITLFDNDYGPRTDEPGSFRRKQEINLHVELVGFIWCPRVSFNCPLVVNRQWNHKNYDLVFKNTRNWWCNIWTSKWTLDVETGVPLLAFFDLS